MKISKLLIFFFSILIISSCEVSNDNFPKIDNSISANANTASINKLETAPLGTEAEKHNKSSEFFVNESREYEDENFRVVYKEIIGGSSEGSSVRGVYLKDKLVFMDIVDFRSLGMTQMSISFQEGLTIISYTDESYSEPFSAELASVDMYSHYIVGDKMYENRMPDEEFTLLPDAEKSRLENRINIFTQILNEE